MKLLPVQETDWEWMLPHMQNAKLLKLIAVQPPDMTKPYMIWVLWLEDGTPAGWIELFNVDLSNRKAEVGISLVDGRASMGLFRIGKRFVKETVFEELGLNRLTARILAFNERALRCARGFGFVQEGVERQGCVRGGEMFDVVLFGLLRSDVEEGERLGRCDALPQGNQNID